LAAAAADLSARLQVQAVALVAVAVVPTALPLRLAQRRFSRKGTTVAVRVHLP
jgi:hypothetical protein